MAENLARAGFEVRAWNRTRAKAEALAGSGVQVADSPAGAARDADILVTMLLDAGAVEEAVFGAQGAAAALAPGAVWAQMSTVGVAGADRLATLAAGAGLAFVDAPVLGTKKPAEDGSLVVLASGPPALAERLGPVFEALGQRTTWLETTGAASRLKMVVNSWVLALDVATAEAVALAEALDLDPKLFLQTIAGSPTDSPYAHLKGDQMLRRDFTASFSVANAAKDARLVVDAASAAGIRLALAEVVRHQLERAAELDHGEEDMAAVYYVAAPRRG